MTPCRLQLAVSSDPEYTSSISPQTVSTSVTGEQSTRADYDSDDDWTHRRRTPATRTKKIIRDPDSDSGLDSDLHDRTSKSEDSDEDAGDVDGKEYDIAKHYDESYGSLRDFIVDDSLSDESDRGEDDSDGDHSSITKPPPYRPALVLPDLQALSLNDSPSFSPSPSRSRPLAKSKPSRRQWEGERERIAAEIFSDLDQRVFGGGLKEAKIEWSKRLLTTAGTAKCSK